jgi:hypothetical protein
MSAKCDPDRLTIERIAARSFVIAGGLFWIVAVFYGGSLHRGGDLVSARNALLPLALTIAVLAVGWYWEYLVAALLAVGSFAVIAWGVTAGWEPGVWTLMLSTLVAPMAISGTLFLFAARMESVSEPERGKTVRAKPAVTIH